MDTLGYGENGLRSTMRSDRRQSEEVLCRRSKLSRVAKLGGHLDDDLAKSCVREVSDFFALPYINDQAGHSVIVALFKIALERV